MKGPDEVCVDDMIPTGGHCASGLRCCGICTGCYKEFKCSQQHCDFSSSTNTLRSKKTLLKPIWFFDIYQQPQEQIHFNDVQQQQGKHQEQRPISQQKSTSFNSIIYMRPDNYRINNLEYIIAREN